MDYDTLESLNGINSWIEHQYTIMETWGMKRILKAGYRALFYGPPGTGKTLAATLLGKKEQYGCLSDRFVDDSVKIHWRDRKESCWAF